MTKLTKKIFALVLLTGGLSFLLGLVGSLSRERVYRKNEVIAEVSQSSAGTQAIEGPVLIEDLELTDGKMHAVERRYTYPRRMKIQAKVSVEQRHRGIFSVPVFNTTQVITGTFEARPLPANATVKAARIIIGIGDTRGFVRPPTLRFDEADVILEPGATETLHGGVLGRISPLAAAHPSTFEIHMELAGSGTVSWSPVAADVEVHVQSSWPHPSFVGTALPNERLITRDGFEATWRTNPFQTGTSLSGAVLAGQNLEWAHASFGVQFASPGDTYAQVDRAVKYGFLFIALTFAVFGVFETTRRMPIHPIQYGMVGVSLVLFFLLLLSLAEHVSFAVSYATATAACISLLVFYLRHVLGGWQRSAGFGGMFAGLYGTLFVLLRLEEFALVVGSGVLFALLATAMIVTRHVNWYRVGEGPERPQEKNPYRAWGDEGAHFGGAG